MARTIHVVPNDAGPTTVGNGWWIPFTTPLDAPLRSQTSAWISKDSASFLCCAVFSPKHEYSLVDFSRMNNPGNQGYFPDQLLQDMALKLLLLLQKNNGFQIYFLGDGNQVGDAYLAVSTVIGSGDDDD